VSILDSLRPAPGLRVLVAAGAGGIGAAIARAFHSARSRVHVCDLDRSALDRLMSQTPGITGSMADASVPADVDAVFDDVRSALGGLDVLISNAGIAGPSGPVEAIDDVSWERTIAVNINSQFYFARRAVPLLKRSSQGCLIATGSRAAHQGARLCTPYAASHWAIVGLVKALAGELGPHGIRVNAILPGSIEGERARAPGTADDVAALALFLCSPAARSLTGQTVCVESPWTNAPRG
jgi:NAD(P)-dependent dehydrogenase (short-subunit alcohol dehydrogenase family)